MGLLVHLFPNKKENQQAVKAKQFSQIIASCCNDASRDGLEMDLLLATCAKVLANAMDRMDDPQGRRQEFLNIMMKD